MIARASDGEAVADLVDHYIASLIKRRWLEVVREKALGS